jgi:transcriptional regulator with XRE-family HTH domain
VESPLSHLAKNLKSLRAAQGITQEYLAEKSGVDYKYLQRIEGEDLPGLRLRTLEKLAPVLKVEPWELIRPHKGKR